MKYRSLGSSGLKVSAIGLGTNNFGWRTNETDATAIIDQAIDLGINFIDTANIYGRGRSEEFIGKGIKAKRSQVILATKFGYATGEEPNEKGGSRYHILNAIDDSLRRLQTDYIDLYQIHVADPTTSIEETLSTLHNLVQMGKVRYIGCSNYSAWQLCEAIWVAKLNNYSPFITVQPRYNLLERQAENELIPCCQQYGIGIIPWGPLIGGFLTGKYQEGKEAPPNSRFSKPMPLYDQIMTTENWDKLKELTTFAEERNHTVFELALAWLLAKPWISVVIPGAREKTQVELNAKASDWELTPEEITAIDNIYTGKQ